MEWGTDLELTTRHQHSPLHWPNGPQAARVWANDMENIPVFFALCGLAIALETAAGPNVWLSIVFTAARVLHTWAYLARVQPLRTVLYGIGVICLLGFCVVVTARVVSFFAL
ncbi:MAPEG family protein [Pseudomonas pudica]|uniref:MAPEG family protein n=1 Tax=Pseudomonas sp. B10(2017) TaxID=1981749 RepID=UPI000A1FD568|nr:MAPEG family protein [Pseudomonas sp. B10(2017)]